MTHPPIEDYGFLSDCHSSALVSREGSIDWCCMPRFDSPSCFARLLDLDRGGHCALTPEVPFTAHRAYLEGSLVLATTFTTAEGEARVIDFFAMREGGRSDPRRQLLRMVEGVHGRVPFRLDLVPRFDYGDIEPWLRHLEETAVAALGGSTGLLISGDAKLERQGDHELAAEFAVKAGQRLRISLQYFRPEQIGEVRHRLAKPGELDHRLQETLTWWQRWSAKGHLSGRHGAAIRRSAIVLKGLTHAPTGAIVAAPTTSLPEQMGGARNWDYRYSWIRDSSFTVRSLAEVGHDSEADGFRRFIERSAAGSADDLQIMYGVGGERRLTEVPLPHLAGYRGSSPVRIGNAAAEQLQLDMYGELVNLSWRWHQRGHRPDADYWRFLVSLTDAAGTRSREPDRSLWEIRGEPRHFVHSKAMCWAAIDRGVRLAEALGRTGPVQRWTERAAELRQEIEARGYDARRGVFTQSYDSPDLDAALLLLPSFGFVEYTDPRMVRTVDAIRDELGADGLVRRYKAETGVDGLQGGEGVFIACTFWLAECLARQGRIAEAQEAFERAAATGNDLGLFAEEWDPAAGAMLGNFPQGLTHLSHVAAAVALADAEAESAAR